MSACALLFKSGFFVFFCFVFLVFLLFTTLVTNSGFSHGTCSKKLCNEMNQCHSPDKMGEMGTTWFTVVFPGCLWNLSGFN